MKNKTKPDGCTDIADYKAEAHADGSRAIAAQNYYEVEITVIDSTGEKKIERLSRVTGQGIRRLREAICATMADVGNKVDRVGSKVDDVHAKVGEFDAKLDKAEKQATKHHKALANPLRALCASRERRRKSTIRGLIALIIIVVAQIYGVCSVHDSMEHHQYALAAMKVAGIIASTGWLAVMAAYFAVLIYAEMVSGAVFEKDEDIEKESE